MTQHEDPSIELTAPGVVRLRTLMANLFFVTTPGTADAPWVLVDAGLPGYRSTIEETARV